MRSLESLICLKTIVVVVVVLGFVCIPAVKAIIFFQGHTTACDICDRTSTNSVRNTMCCFKFSKCCIPDTLDEYNSKVAYEDRLGRSNYPATLHVPYTSGSGNVAAARRAAAAAANKANRSTRRRSANQKKKRRTTKPKQRSRPRQRAADRVVEVEWR